jgi:hypothetical protein
MNNDDKYSTDDPDEEAWLDVYLDLLSLLRWN